jgi:transposase
MRKRAYRATAVKNVNITAVCAELPEGSIQVGIDIAKEEFLVVIRDGRGCFSRPWKVRQPSEISFFVKQLQELASHRQLSVAMESTGTYGDVLRQALTDAGIEVRLVSSLHTKQHAEVFDGVPSNHDGKDAAIVAELAAYGKSKPWAWREGTTWEQTVERTADWLDAQQDILQVWLGRLESLLARHWPEILSLMKLNSGTMLRMLAKYGGPSEVAKDPSAADCLRRWGGSFLSEAKIQRIVIAAQTSLGVRMSKEKLQVIQLYAQQALEARKEVQRAKTKLREWAKKNAVVQRMAQVVGDVTACVLWAAVGDPRKYHCARAYLKALGLNLKVRSSGKHEGKLKITKRGPSRGRRWLYFSSLRTVQQAPVRAWYEAKKLKDKNQGLCGLVAVMRKLAMAVHAVTCRPDPFELQRLFPGRPWRSPMGDASPAGALPPDPRDLSLSCQSRKGKGKQKKGGVTNESPPPDLSILAPGAALGTVPTGALSSVQSKKHLARTK